MSDDSDGKDEDDLKKLGKDVRLQTNLDFS
jgi:hypothetical protein